MNFDLQQAILILARTPAVLKMLLENLSDEWILNDEGPDTFSPFDVIGHLIQGEKTDWVVRAKIIIDQGKTRPFDSWDRFAQLKESRDKNIGQLLSDFDMLRKKNLDWLQRLNLKKEDFEKSGIHPELGEVSMKNLLSTWVVHDLTHIAQITRVMAKQYKNEIGPWPVYFRILQ